MVDKVYILVLYLPHITLLDYGILILRLVLYYYYTNMLKLDLKSTSINW